MRARHGLRLGCLAAALGASALAPARAEAGIVVLENGEVLVGRISPGEDTPDALVVRWPYRDHLALCAVPGISGISGLAGPHAGALASAAAFGAVALSFARRACWGPS